MSSSNPGSVIWSTSSKTTIWMSHRKANLKLMRDVALEARRQQIWTSSWRMTKLQSQGFMMQLKNVSQTKTTMTSSSMSESLMKAQLIANLELRLPSRTWTPSQMEFQNQIISYHQIKTVSTTIASSSTETPLLQSLEILKQINSSLTE